MKDVLVEIRTARESFPAFDARLFEEENFLAIRGEFEITYDKDTVCVMHGMPLKYRLEFAEGVSRAACIETPYGTTRMHYTVSKVSFKKTDGRYVFKIAYRQQDSDSLELYTITVTEKKQGVLK